MKPLPFRFDDVEHVYYVNDKPIPNISSMLQRTGYVDPTYYTDESRERGRAVHALTADVDLRAVNPATLVSKYRGYVLAHVDAMARLRVKEFVAVEEPVVQPLYKFGGRPDRIVKLFRVLTVLDEKSGGPEKWHAIQTALQAILVAWKFGLKPESIGRSNVYLTDAGDYKIKTQDKRRDFDKAFEVIKECCR